MHDAKVRFGNAVRMRRSELGITQEELAERAKMHRTYVADVERGTRNISLVNIVRLVYALNLTLSEFFGRFEETQRRA